MFTSFLIGMCRAFAMVLIVTCTILATTSTSIVVGDEDPSSPACYGLASNCQTSPPGCPWTFPTCAPHGIGCSCQ